MKRFCVIGLWLLGCSASDGPSVQQTAAPLAQTLSVTAPPTAIAVATVNGDPIYDFDVRVQAETRGVDVRTALGDLIEAQLLAQEALRRNLAADPDVVEAGKRERVRRFIARQFLDGFNKPADIPDKMVREMYSRRDIKHIYVHEAFRTALYTRVVLDKEADGEPLRKAFAVAREIRKSFVEERPKDGAAMHAIATPIAKTHGVVVETPEQPFAAPRHGVAVESFAKAMFAIRQEGGFSEPTRTQWGVDIIQLLTINPPRNVSYEQASAEIREKIFTPAQRRGFDEWVTDLVARAHVTRADELLSEIDVVSSIDLNVKPTRPRPVQP